jgi:hypothetical protein
VVGRRDAYRLDAVRRVERPAALAERDGQHLDRGTAEPAWLLRELESARVNVDERADVGAGLRVVAEERRQADAD